MKKKIIKIVTRYLITIFGRLLVEILVEILSNRTKYHSPDDVIKLVEVFLLRKFSMMLLRWLSTPVLLALVGVSVWYLSASSVAPQVVDFSTPVMEVLPPTSPIRPPIEPPKKPEKRKPQSIRFNPEFNPEKWNKLENSLPSSASSREVMIFLPLVSRPSEREIIIFPETWFRKIEITLPGVWIMCNQQAVINN